MAELRDDLPELPRRMRKLPIDKRGYPVPAFVAEIDGEWDFRVIKPGFLPTATRKRLCWLCGEPLGRNAVFVIGPMCVINRVSSEPPSHLDCAMFAVRACPFLTRPLAKRDERDLPEDASAAGIMIKRNPKCCTTINTRQWRPFRVENGFLIRIEEPFTVEWWSHGREATPEEIAESIATGLPILEEGAHKDGERAVVDLKRQTDAVMKYLPEAAVVEINRRLHGHEDR